MVLVPQMAVLNKYIKRLPLRVTWRHQEASTAPPTSLRAAGMKTLASGGHTLPLDEHPQECVPGRWT